jgi:hypothetical protein
MAEDAATKNPIDNKLSVTRLGGSTVSHIAILGTILTALTAMQSDKMKSFVGSLF